MIYLPLVLNKVGSFCIYGMQCGFINFQLSHFYNPVMFILGYLYLTSYSLIDCMFDLFSSRIVLMLVNIVATQLANQLIPIFCISHSFAFTGITKTMFTLLIQPNTTHLLIVLIVETLMYNLFVVICTGQICLLYTSRCV